MSLYTKTILGDETSTKLPNWVYPSHASDLAALIEELKKKKSWDSTETYILEGVVKYAQRYTKNDCLIKVSHFLSLLKTTENITRRDQRIQAFFHRMAEAGIAAIEDTDDNSNITLIKLTMPQVAEEIADEISFLPFTNFIQTFYKRRDFDKLLSEKGLTLPCLEKLPKFIDTPRENILKESYIFESTAVDENKRPLFTQETITNTTQKLIGIAIHPRDTKETTTATESPIPDYTLLFDSTSDIKDILHHFILPLLNEFLERPSVKSTYERMRSIRIQKAKVDGKIKGYPTMEYLVKNILKGPEANVEQYYNLTELMHRLLENMRRDTRNKDIPIDFTETPIIYQAVRLINDYAIACHGVAFIENARREAIGKDARILEDYLLKEYVMDTDDGPMPQSLVSLGKLKDCTGKQTLGEKYQDIRQLIAPKSEAELLPHIIEIDDRYIHRWQFINYLITRIRYEEKRVQDQLVEEWSTAGIPQTSKLSEIITERDISEYTLLIAEKAFSYYMGVPFKLTAGEDPVVFFMNLFFPDVLDAQEYKINHLVQVRDTSDGAVSLRKYVLKEIEKLLCKKDKQGIRSQQSVPEMLHLDITTAKARARFAMSAYITNIFTMLLYRFLFHIGSVKADDILKQAVIKAHKPKTQPPLTPANKVSNVIQKPKQQSTPASSSKTTNHAASSKRPPISSSGKDKKQSSIESLTLTLKERYKGKITAAEFEKAINTAIKAGPDTSKDDEKKAKEIVREHVKNVITNILSLDSDFQELVRLKLLQKYRR